MRRWLSGWNVVASVVSLPGTVTALFAVPPTVIAVVSRLSGADVLLTLRRIGGFAILAAFVIWALGSLAAWIYGRSTGKDLLDRLFGDSLLGQDSPFRPLLTVLLA